MARGAWERYGYCPDKPTTPPSPIAWKAWMYRREDEVHDKDYFFEKAEQYPFLEGVIEGTSSYVSRLDSILDDIEDNAKVLKKDSERIDELASYLDEIREISGEYFFLDAYKQHGRDLESLKRSKAMMLGAWAGTAGSLVLVLIPPFNLIEIVIGGAAVSFGEKLEKRLQKARKVKWNRRKAFNLPYLTAERIDLEIGKAFAAEHFLNAPEFFEQTYAGMSSEEQNELQPELERMLEAGMINMDEQELDTYLADILALEEEE